MKFQGIKCKFRIAPTFADGIPSTEGILFIDSLGRLEAKGPGINFANAQLDGWQNSVPGKYPASAISSGVHFDIVEEVEVKEFVRFMKKHFNEKCKDF